jgi:hypothetical protein
VPKHYHAIVWIDHHEARVGCFGRDDADVKVLHPAHPAPHLHSKAGSASGIHIKGEDRFYAEVAAALAPLHAFVVVGPSSAKTEFVDYMRKHAAKLLPCMAGIETRSRMSDNELIAEGRRYFKAADRMSPQIG